MRTLLFTSSLYAEGDVGVISSRLGISAPAEMFGTEDDLFQRVNDHLQESKIDCVFVDEAQFLTSEQVWQLSRIVDVLDLPVMAYGLRTDFRGELFPGSKGLLAIADELTEARSICHCGRKATMVVRLGADGRALKDGAQVMIGGNETYMPLCRRHWQMALSAEDNSLKIRLFRQNRPEPASGRHDRNQSSACCLRSTQYCHCRT
jgi:thymidine kinase